MEANNGSDTYETVYFRNEPGSTNTADHSAAVNKHTRTYEYISYRDAVENLSNPSEHHLNEKKFLDLNDSENLSFLDDFQAELDQHIPQASVAYMKFRGRKHKSFTAWVVLKKNSPPFRVDASFLEKSTNDPKVTAVTLVSYAEEVRGLRISLKESKARLYEIINGVYEIEFHWKVGSKDCAVLACVNSNGTVAFRNLSKDIVSEDFEKNGDVNIRIGNVGNTELTLAELILHGNPIL